MLTVPAGSVENTLPFNVVLRALTGQRYTIQENLAQNLRTFRAQIPTTATGGKANIPQIATFYADYTGNDGLKSVSSNQIVISGAIVTTTSNAPTATATDSTQPNGSAPASDTGISGGMLAGIIGGVVVVLLLVAMVFISRNRRRVAVAKADSPSTDDHKERGFTSGPDTYSSKSEDKESLTRSAGSGGGPHDDGMVVVPLNGGPDPRSPGPENRPHTPQQQHQMPYGGHPTRSPYESSERSMPSPAMSPRQQPQPQQQRYQPPLESPTQLYGGMANPLMPPQQTHQQQQLQRNQHSRNSVDSELDSAYDPNNASMTNRGAGTAPNMRGTGAPSNNGAALSHSPSGGSRYPHAASPVQANRQPSPDPRSTSPLVKAREIEMQPLDVQQHHYEQQQRALQRQQQQQQQQQQQLPPQVQQHQPMSPIQPPSPQQQIVNPLPAPVASPSSAMASTPTPPSMAAPSPAPAAPTAPKNPFNPTLYDDKAEVAEEPVYNGYRDTIFGAYSQPQGDDDDEDSDSAVPVPVVPMIPSNQGSPATMELISGPVEIQRKKSIKFTGASPSGPIVLPDNEAAKEHQQQRQQKQMQKQQHEQQQQRATSGDADYDDEDEDEDEDDIKLRLMETESASPVSSTASRPFIDTNIGASSSYQNATVSALSPVQSPDQTGYVAPPPPLAQQGQSIQQSPGFDTDAAFGNGFYEDVLAAVEKDPVPQPQGMNNPAPQQRHTPPPPPPPQQLHPITQEVYGAPSPRIAPAAVVMNGKSNQHQLPPAPSPRYNAPPPVAPVESELI
ncbi:hypothetical protein BGZ51_007208 [Haplosporangium sp. Z 767]|nr:hypothetical protein BGZ51_007208 [Haplosporangium sp. Z 767]KAF9193661.1 hypothetical protein BGZ50_007237 [Haplosporangium sp. Z 11]